MAVAAAVKADRCDIYTDVDGVYTTDPRIVAKARKLKAVTLRGNARAGLGRVQGAADPLGQPGDEGKGAGAGAVVASSTTMRPWPMNLPGTLIVSDGRSI